MEEKIETVKNWLGSGSINVFGLPFSGKDTQAHKLAELLGGAMFSSGDILRQNKDNQELQRLLDAGQIIPSELFKQIVVPYFSRPEFAGKPLILSEVGRMGDEKQVIIEAAMESGHPQKAVILLKLPDEAVFKRFEALKQEKDRGARGDDRHEVLQTRLNNYRAIVMPVIDWYRQTGLLLEVDGTKSRQAVTESIISGLYERTKL
jgi:adenylate kinase